MDKKMTEAEEAEFRRDAEREEKMVEQFEEIEERLQYWNTLKEVPKEAKKKITGGRISGMTDIKPQWRLMVMTETFGPCGIGWKYTIDRQWSEPGSENQLMCFVNVSLYIKIDGNWSEPIPGNGGNMLITKEKAGLHSSDEGYKMALTDALSVAMKAIGVGADVYMGMHEGKYADKNRQASNKKTPPGSKSITKSQVDHIISLLVKKQVGEEVIFKEFGIKSLKDLTLDTAGDAIRFLSLLQENKAAQRIMCADTDKFIDAKTCDTCDSRVGCPSHPEDIKL